MTSRALINPLAKNSGVSLRATIQNPRPRKYASDADRQKAFRERQAVIQVRVAPKAVETFDEIAETLGYSRQEVVYALLMKGLMSLGNWETVGLPVDWQRKMPQFKIPRYEENPMMRKATPAQIAARERFAEMARSGAFKRKAKAATKRKKNPLSYGLEGTVKITDTYERSVAASRNLAEHYANQLRMRGRDDIVYVVFGITPEAKKQAGRYKNGVTITLDPRDYEIAYAFHPTQGEISQQLKAKRVAERRAYARERIGRMPNPAEAKERKPRVVLITNPKQRMGLIAFRTAGGALTTKEVPILFSFKLPVAANLYGEKSTMDFFAHKDGREIAVTEKTTGFKLGNIPRVFMAVGRDEKAAAKYFVEDLLKQHGAAKFRAAVESKPKIA